MCHTSGACSLSPTGHVCTVSTDADCQKSEACTKHNHCTRKDGQCQ